VRRSFVNGRLHSCGGTHATYDGQSDACEVFKEDHWFAYVAHKPFVCKHLLLGLLQHAVELCLLPTV